MAALMKTIDPELKKYIQFHRLPEIYEALLSGLVIMCPHDPHKFIIKKLKFIKAMGLECLQWDMFIEAHMHPKQRIISESNLDFLFNFDENTQPTPEMYEKAYNHYNNRLMCAHFSAWMQFHLRKRMKRIALERNIKRAVKHYEQRISKLVLSNWLQWLRFRKGCQSIAFNKINHVYHVAVGRVIFKAWHNVTLDAKRTREYFERLERGENVDDDVFVSKDEGEARDEVSMLPHNVAVKILSYVDMTDLAKCSQVCRSWKVLTQANALWTRIDLTPVSHRVTDKITSRLLSKCRPYLVHLNLRGCSAVTANTFYAIRECRNLQDLNLSECSSITDDLVKMVVEGCKILLYLNLSYNAITDASLRSVAKFCNNLQYLSIAFCSFFTDKGLLYLAQSKCSKRLMHVDLSGCIQISKVGYQAFSEGCKEIQSLVLDDITTLNDICLEAIAKNCKMLSSVSLLGSYNIGDEGLKAIASSKKIQKIKIDSNPGLTDASFKYLGKQSPDLRHIYITDCQKITDVSLKAYITCRNLTIINLADCVRITDVGVRHIVESPCGGKLQELNLTNCIRVGDIALVNIHKRCHNLAYLSVCYCEHISEAGIELLGQTHSLTSLDISGCNCADQGLSSLGNNIRLKDVNLSDCSAITDLGMQKFVQQCTDIQSLDLSHCLLLTDGAIKILAFSCRMLTDLSLFGCKLLTDLSIQYLSGVCHHIIKLDISGSLHITDKSIKYLKKGCPSLRSLIMLYCRHITKRAAHKAQKYIPEIQYSSEEMPYDVQNKQHP